MDLPRPFGPYTLFHRLAVGGMAEVYAAKARGIGGFEKIVAIKLIHPRLSEDDAFIQMLIEEAKISVLLTHINVVQVFDLGCVDGLYFIVMEYVEGIDAYRLLRKAWDKKIALPMEICAFIVQEICHGLHYAHDRRDAEGRPLGIVHRDISPQNVLISQSGEVKLADFGIAKAAVRAQQTDAGVIKGKYHYMSPEQAWGDPTDHRSDLFSAGVVLYELLTGEMLYQEESIPLLLDRVRKADIHRPSLKRPDIPAELDRIVMRAVAKDPTQRFESAEQFSHELSSVLFQIAPSFSSAQLAALVQELCPPTQIADDSEATKAPQSVATTSSPTRSLPVMSPGEFAPDPLRSVIFDASSETTAAHRPRGSDEETAPFPTGREPGEWTTDFTLDSHGWRKESTTRQTAVTDFGPEAGSWEERTLVTPTKIPEESSPVEEELRTRHSSERPSPVVEPRSDRAADSIPTPAQPLHSVRPSARPSTSPPSSIPPSAKPLPSPNTRSDRPTSLDANPPIPDSKPSQPAIRDPWTLPDGTEMLPVKGPSLSPGRAWALATLVSLVLVTIGALLAFLVRAATPEPIVEIISVPAGAELRLDGAKVKGRTPLTLRDSLVPGVTYRLDLAKPGYENWSSSFEAVPRRVKHIAVLSPQRLTVHVETDPKGAAVWIDGVMYGTSPVDIPGISVGRTVEVRATHPGYREVRRSFTAVTGDLEPHLRLELPRRQR